VVLQGPERVAPLRATGDGYHQATLEDVEPGRRYLLRLDGARDRPDPASRHQPEGVHGPSEVVNASFPWTDAGWFGRPLREYVTYELHVGTFSSEGTFDGVVPHLDALRELGATAVELMPVAEFPGRRNWGYDGVCPFAAHSAYGGPSGLRRLVDSCHARGLSVVLDVVYNHLGPEGNYLAELGPYFTDRYLTPWGPAINFDGRGSDEVRAYFIQNARYWMDECHVDALRLDAVHAIRDHSAHPFLQELAERTSDLSQTLNRRLFLIAETDQNDPRLARSRERGGYGLDAQWSDDLHHALHTLLTGEHSGYYCDFGELEHLERAYRDAYAYTGQRSAFRGRRHGQPPSDLPGERFVVASQNHDQVGNRMYGERLSTLLDLEGRKLAAGAVILSPFLPLLFMGEEYGETAPFLYFVSHHDPGLVEAVRRGRREEFVAFAWKGEPPDPQSEETFEASKLDHSLARQGEHRRLREFYAELLRLRLCLSPLRSLSRDRMRVSRSDLARALWLHRTHGDQQVLVVLRFGGGEGPVALELPPGTWRLELDSADAAWGGPGSRVPRRPEGGGHRELPMPPQSLIVLSRGERP
jgi:maltooligosyltrehalose trehalohydrolase